MRFGPRISGLWCNPPHDWHRADAVLWAALDNSIAIGNVNQHISLAVEETHNLKLLEHEAAALVKNALTVLEFAEDLDGADLTTGDAGVARVLRHAQFTLNSACLRAADMAGDALNFGVVEAVNHNFVVGSEPAEMGADGPGCAALGATEKPPSTERNDQNDSCAEYNPEFFQDDLPFLNGYSNSDSMSSNVSSIW